MASAELRAGYAGGDITPEPGLDLGGYWGRSSRATEVHDALEAKVLVFGQANARAALVALDVVGLEQLVHRLHALHHLPKNGGRGAQQQHAAVVQ